MKKELKQSLLIVLVVLVVSIVGISFAYFVASASGSGTSDIEVNVGDTATLEFVKGDDLTIDANLTNFSEGLDSLSSESTTKAILTSDTNASETYNVYFNINSNDFEYTTDDATPELVLSITKPDGTELSSVDGLTYTTENGVTGFDVTTKTGLITIASDYVIEKDDSSADVTDEWIFTLHLVNLDSNQNDNNGKTFDSEVIVQSESYIPTNLSDKILYDNGGTSYIENKGKPNFNIVSDDENEGMFAMDDDYGTSYYYRGAVDNNWVSFAGYYWRIIRVNGDGSVKMIYSGVTAPVESQKVVMTGTGTQISSSVFNPNYNSAEYVGYMYTLGSQHGLGSSSNIKTVLETWYETNILDKGYNDLVADTAYCGDRTAYTVSGTLASPIFTESSGIGSAVQNFGATKRIGGYLTTINSFYLPTNIEPSFTCPIKEDKYTVEDVTNGNGSTTYPVSLITADEASAAGLRYYMADGSSDTTGNYLYTGSYYWALSPSMLYSGYANVYSIYSTGNLGTYNSYGVSRTGGAVRPAVSLKSDILVSGSGEWNDPYMVVS